MIEWVFPDLVDECFLQDDEEALMRAREAMHSYGELCQERKATNMTTRKNSTTATTTTTPKETTMTDAKPKMTPEEREAAKQARYVQRRAGHDEKVAELLAKNPQPAFDRDPVWFINVLESDRTGKRLTSPIKTTGKFAEHDRQEMVYLRMAASVFGWTDDSFATVSQAERYQGHLKDENMEGWEVQSGDTYWFTAYPYSAFEWDTESGLPEYDEEAGAQREATQAERKARRLERQAKQARKAATVARKAAPKPTTSDKRVVELEQQLATLQKQNEEQAARFDRLMALMEAKLG